MPKLAVAVKSFDNTPFNTLLIKGLNALVKQGVSIMGLYETLAVPPEEMRFPVMQLFEGYAYEGPIISFTYGVAEKVLRFPRSSPKFFYVGEAHWVNTPNKKYSELFNVYGNIDHEIVVNSEKLGKLVANCWNREVKYIVENMNLESLLL